MPPANDADAIRDGLNDLARLAREVAARAAELLPIVAAMRATIAGDGTIFLAGNGGSAADAQHLATEYAVRFHAGQRRAFRAIALTTDSSALTAAANDFGFDQVFARQLEALARPGDLLVLHSTSGDSANLIEAARRATALGVHTVALLGKGGGALAALVEHAFVVPDANTARIQELHLAIQHQVAALITEAPTG